MQRKLGRRVLQLVVFAFVDTRRAKDGFTNNLDCMLNVSWAFVGFTSNSDHVSFTIFYAKVAPSVGIINILISNNIIVYL